MKSIDFKFCDFIWKFGSSYGRLQNGSYTYAFLVKGSEPLCFLTTPPLLPTHHFSNSVQLPLPHFHQRSLPLLIMLPFFQGWMGDPAVFDVLFYLMISWMYTCRALRPWCMFYATMRQVYWVLTPDVAFFLYSDLISDIHTHKHTHKDTQHTSGPVDWRTHVNVYLHQVLCAHSSYLYCNEWIIHWYQKLTSHNTFSFQNLFTC